MAFEELKKKQSVIWGNGPYERLPGHYEPLLDHLARGAAVRAGERVLDVATGTGSLALRLARSGAEVTGVDLALALIDTARRLAAEAGLGVRYEVGDAEDLPYDDASFDVVLSTLFFHHLPDDGKRQTAAELMRVLRPGGRLVVGDLARPHDPLMRLAVLVTVQLLDGVATTALNVRGELPDVLAGAGFESVRLRDRLRTPTGTYAIVTARRGAARRRARAR